MTGYQLTKEWFQPVKQNVWKQLLPKLAPTKILEIGSFEGASACFLIDFLGANSEIELHCVDTWEGSIEQRAPESGIDMAAVEARFKENIAVACENAAHKPQLVIHKQSSDECLAQMVVEGKKNYFDLIYVDGSHQASDVLCDAVLSFKLLRLGGLIIFDDYLWAPPLPHGRDPLRSPKPAIDAFVNLHYGKLSVLRAPLDQLHVLKMTD